MVNLDPTAKLATALLNSKAGNGINKGLAKFSQTKPMQKLTQHCVNNATKPAGLSPEALKKSAFIAGPVLAIASIVTKDLFGCACYVYNDLTNKKIPEQQRPFSAAWDFANGITTVIVTSLAPIILTKPLENMFDKSTSKFFAQENINKIAKSVASQTGISIEEATKQTSEKLSNIQSVSKGAFSTLTSLVVAGIFAKRVICPLISTPIASKIKPFVAKAFGGGGKKKKTNESKETAQKAAPTNIEQKQQSKLNKTA